MLHLLNITEALQCDSTRSTCILACAENAGLVYKYTGIIEG